MAPYIFKGARVLDVGCGNGALFSYFSDSIVDGIGLDNALTESVVMKSGKLLPGILTRGKSGLGSFDVVTMLALLEHIHHNEQVEVAQAAAQRLKPGGFILITVPSPKVDYILKVISFFHMTEGMHIDQHYGFDPVAVPSIFSIPGLRLAKHVRFQLGLNHFFAFRKDA